MNPVNAHTQNVTLRIVEFFPDHEPRSEDPHYRTFNAVRRRLKALGRLKCWVDNHDCAGGIELHHATVEYALANGVDIGRFEELYPEFGLTDEESFVTWIESEGNLLPLCVAHHRGAFGVHSLTYPSWIAQRFWKADLPAPAKKG